MGGRRPRHWQLTSWLVLAGCFSQDDFRLCRSDDDCGGAGFCIEGRCDRLTQGDAGQGGPEDAPTNGPEPDRGPPVDAGPDLENCPTTSLVNDRGSGLYECPGQTVTIDTFQTADANGRALTTLTVRAARIEIAGSLNSQGAGFRGGGGGGGGGGAVTGEVHQSPGGTAGTGQSPGSAGVEGGAVPGPGGQGGQGGGPANGAGAPGAPGLGPSEAGRPGGDGRHLDLATPAGQWEPVLCDPRTSRPGAGGGGGGGGAGATADTCTAGPGGGGGGAGSPGGGAVHLYATDEIVVRGEIDVSGGARLDAPPPEIAGADGCGSVESCNSPCGEAPGAGARGGSSGHSGQPGTPGGNRPDGLSSGGAGGDGGLGGGGFILLHAPRIRWEAGARLNLSGAALDNPGILLVVGEEVGARPAVDGPAWLCPPRPYEEP